ncbi:hypothetical protein GCM10009737_19630 [Nocardioides lentus]|uniref:PH domain-containing protein n=1 Tax=Nocardioides lentus TaxID=338077 RepID=A0ABN2PF66_9ACTN
MQEPTSPDPGPPGEPPPGLVAAIGPPRPVDASRRTAVLVALCLLMVVPAAIGGHGMARADGDISGPAPWLLLALITFTALFIMWPGFVVRLRSDGRVLEGFGLLGRQRVDLTRLTSVASTVSARSVVVQLRDREGALMFDSRFLRRAGPAVVRAVGHGVWLGQERGEYVVPRGAAQLWGMPTKPEATLNARTGAIPRQLAVIAMLAAALAVGAVVGAR